MAGEGDDMFSKQRLTSKQLLEILEQDAMLKAVADTATIPDNSDLLHPTLRSLLPTEPRFLLTAESARTGEIANTSTIHK